MAPPGLRRPNDTSRGCSGSGEGIGRGRIVPNVDQQISDLASLIRERHDKPSLQPDRFFGVPEEMLQQIGAKDPLTLDETEFDAVLDSFYEQWIWFLPAALECVYQDPSRSAVLFGTVMIKISNEGPLLYEDGLWTPSLDIVVAIFEDWTSEFRCDSPDGLAGCPTIGDDLDDYLDVLLRNEMDDVFAKIWADWVGDAQDPAKPRRGAHMLGYLLRVQHKWNPRKLQRTPAVQELMFNKDWLARTWSVAEQLLMERCPEPYLALMVDTLM